ncbi:MAG: response regulator [Elusimicrobiota bacterium]
MGYRILIVDDSPMSRILLREMLESMGHQVIGEADSGSAGLEAYGKLKPDLITLDISLPDMDGIQVLRELRRTSNGAKVVLVSGNDQKKILDQAKVLKAPLVCKPFDIKTLTGALSIAAGSPAPGGIR